MAPDKSFGILLTAGAIGALWLYNTGRLNAVWQAIQGGGTVAPAKVYPPSAPGGAPIPEGDILKLPPAGVTPPAGVGNLPPVLPGAYHAVTGAIYG